LQLFFQQIGCHNGILDLLPKDLFNSAGAIADLQAKQLTEVSAF
jgi:hypothetical protein